MLSSQLHWTNLLGILVLRCNTAPCTGCTFSGYAILILVAFHFDCWPWKLASYFGMRKLHITWPDFDRVKYLFGSIKCGLSDNRPIWAWPLTLATNKLMAACWVCAIFVFFFVFQIFTLPEMELMTMMTTMPLRQQILLFAVSLFPISIKTKANVDDMCIYAAKISVNWKARKSVTTDPPRPPFDVWTDWPRPCPIGHGRCGARLLRTDNGNAVVVT